jgi:hypothetical protein
VKNRRKRVEIYDDTARSSPKPASPKETRAVEEVTSAKNSSERAKIYTSTEGPISKPTPKPALPKEIQAAGRSLPTLGQQTKGAAKED